MRATTKTTSLKQFIIVKSMSKNQIVATTYQAFII